MSEQLPYVIATAPNDQLRLRFKHSIYDSTVEEIFTIREQGLKLTQLRYGEARLVDFYGHEQARQEKGFWVVNPEPVLLPTLNLRRSDGTAMSLDLISGANSREIPLPRGASARVAVAACDKMANG